MSQFGSACRPLPRRGRLDMNHGFLKTIQKDLLSVAAKSNFQMPLSRIKSFSDMGESNVAVTESMCNTKMEAFENTFVPLDLRSASCEEMIELADLEQYVANARPFISLAISDPKALSSTELSQVSWTLVERACQGVAYYDVAAVLCGYIALKEEGRQEMSTIPDARFVRVTLEACSHRMNIAEQMRSADVRCWISFCLFVTELYLQMRVRGSPLRELQLLLFSVLSQLSCPPCCENLEEVTALATVFKQSGQELYEAYPDKFDKLIDNLRDAFLAGGDVQCSSIMLMLIELHASHWNLTDAAKEYYDLY